MGGDLGESPDVAHYDRLAERERGEQHPRLLGVAVRENDQVGAAEVGRELGVGNEPGHEAHPSPRALGLARRPSRLIPSGRPTTHSSAPSSSRNASSSTSTPL